MYLTGTNTPAARSPHPHPEGTTVFSSDVHVKGDLVLGNKIIHKH